MSAVNTLSQNYLEQSTQAAHDFNSWDDDTKFDFVEQLLGRMCHAQLRKIDIILKPVLQRDFIGAFASMSLTNISQKILGYLDADSLTSADQVSSVWREVISSGQTWKLLIERKIRSDSIWYQLIRKLGLSFYFDIPVREAISLDETPQSPPVMLSAKLIKDSDYYRSLYPKLIILIDRIKRNWREGRVKIHRINCESELNKGVYCLQYDDDKIVSGLRDNTIKIWDRVTLECRNILRGHDGSVLCLQYDDSVVISGSSDSTVRVWCVNTGKELSVLRAHKEAVLHLRFNKNMLVTCSKDHTVAVWSIKSPTTITLLTKLAGHRAAINVVDFDDKYIVSASGDRTIRVWDANNFQAVRSLVGHRRGIACLQYRDRLIVSGSSDNTIRLWDVEQGICLRIMEGHDELVRCIRMDSRYIVSGAYDGKIKVWDLQAAMDPLGHPDSQKLCIATLCEHTGRVFRLQFDEFQIISSSHDDTIVIWDFFNIATNEVRELFGAGETLPTQGLQMDAAECYEQKDKSVTANSDHMDMLISLMNGSLHKNLVKRRASLKEAHKRRVRSSSNASVSLSEAWLRYQAKSSNNIATLPSSSQRIQLVPSACDLPTAAAGSSYVSLTPNDPVVLLKPHQSSAISLLLNKSAKSIKSSSPANEEKQQEQQQTS
ncbi:hypothetical protein Ciccas_006750 [Cichlidogyrus casuarinus]|uniref:D domain-containing protein n=1 Tax=Cichlidogyrus casuarinus TaxID=1844966 RepID=A0ABD2Q636_9PLAT